MLDELPLSPNRKVDRRALAGRVCADLAAAPVVVTDARPPETPAQQRLHAIWCQVLGRTDIGVHDNFFGLGGDSIRGLTVVTLAREAGLALTVRDLFDRQTIFALAALASSAPDSSGSLGGSAASGGSGGATGDAGRATGLSDSQLQGALARLRKG
jgi:aryl carrier-like protein